jgi:2-C-methyl-D-erythritol 4-phosphate cytidylyltransferase
LFPKRDIFAVCFGLWQQCSKDSLHLEHSCHKSSQTFGKKSLNVSYTTPFNHIRSNMCSEMERMKTEVIVVAAGAGKRLNVKVPKALVLLKGKPLIAYCLNIFEKHPGIDGVVIVGAGGLLSKFIRLTRSFKKIRAVVAGGVLRSDSVKCGLTALASDTRIVLVHDAARPFVDRPMIDRLLAALKKNKSAIVGVPVKFTVKKINRKTLDIQETPVRDLLWEAQTPQGFRKDILVKAHAKKFKEEATDDAMMVERMGGRVKMVMGNYRNIKVTTPEDIILAQQLLTGSR